MPKVKCAEPGCENHIKPETKEDAEKKKGWRCIHHGGQAVQENGDPVVA